MVISEGLIFRGWQLVKDFHNLFLGFAACILPMEHVLIKEKFKDENHCKICEIMLLIDY